MTLWTIAAGLGAGALVIAICIALAASFLVLRDDSLDCLHPLLGYQIATAAVAAAVAIAGCVARTLFG